MSLKESGFAAFLTRWGKRRRQLLVNADFQLKLVVFFFGIVFLAFYICIKTMRSAFSMLLIEVEKMNLPRDHMIQGLILRQEKLMYGILGVSLLLIVVFLILGGLYLSNHVAGPLHRLRGHMQRIMTGQDVTEFHPRKKDFFQEFYLDFNKLIQYLKQGKSAKTEEKAS